MIDYTMFPLGVKVIRNTEENKFTIINPFEKALIVAWRYGDNWVSTILLSDCSVTFELELLALGHANNILVFKTE